MEAMFAKFERCPVPTIAAIPGICTGGAAVIAAACDLQARHPQFQVRVSRSRARSPTACRPPTSPASRCSPGVGRAVDMLMTTRLIEADEALAIGLVNELLDTPRGADGRAHSRSPPRSRRRRR